MDESTYLSKTCTSSTNGASSAATAKSGSTTAKGSWINTDVSATDTFTASAVYIVIRGYCCHYGIFADLFRRAADPLT